VYEGVQKRGSFLDYDYLLRKPRDQLGRRVNKVTKTVKAELTAYGRLQAAVKRVLPPEGRRVGRNLRVVTAESVRHRAVGRLARGDQEWEVEWGNTTWGMPMAERKGIEIRGLLAGKEGEADDLRNIKHGTPGSRPCGDSTTEGWNY